MSTSLSAIYTRQNCDFAGLLNWGLTVFWRQPPESDAWYGHLASALEGDGIRLLCHRLSAPSASQFLISSRHDVVPLQLVQRVKGRLQYYVRDRYPKALRKKYALRSIGQVSRPMVEQYVASQLDHHRMADLRAQRMLQRFQIVRPEVDLSVPRRTSGGINWYNLHVVLVHASRESEIRGAVLQDVHDMILRVARVKNYELSRAGILADHLHVTLGCPLDTAPDEVALSFLNNLAYVHGMTRVFQFGAYVGTFGEYTTHAIKDNHSDWS